MSGKKSCSENGHIWGPGDRCVFCNTDNLGKREKEFLTELATLLEKYKATIFYTNDDNGIHIEIDDEKEIFVGFLHGDDAAQLLLEERNRK